MALVDDLLTVATELAQTQGAGRPPQARLRRAVSTAYYAIFHEVSDAVVRALLTGKRSQTPLNNATRRTLDHANLKKAAEWFAGGKRTNKIALLTGTVQPPRTDLVDLCNAILQLQESRHSADYDKGSLIALVDAKAKVAEAKAAVAACRKLDANTDEDVRIFLVGCLLGEKLTKRI